MTGEAQTGFETAHRIGLAAVSILLLLLVLELVRRGLLKERYALLWLAASAFGLIIGIFPQIIVFLAGALPLSGQVVAGLTAYAADGGLLVFFPRSGGSLEEYRAWDCLPGIPTGVAALSGADSRRMLTWDAPQHPLLRPLRDSLAMPQISLQRCLTWETLHPQAVRLISAGASTPLLLQRDYGRGSVLMFSVSADRSWSSLPLSPFYLPLVMQILEHSGRVGAQAPFVWCADSVPMNGLVRHLEAEGALLDPDGRPVPVRSVAGAGREAAPAATLHIPGIYRLQAADGAGEPAPLVAANAPREESDLTPLEPGRLAQLLGVDALYTATDLETLQQAIREHRVGRTYGEHLLLLALLLIGVECLYANRLSRQTPGLTHRLGLTRSGRISGKRLAAAEPASREAAS